MRIPSHLHVAWAAGILTATACAPASNPSANIDALVQQGLQTARAQMTVEAAPATTVQSPYAVENTFVFDDLGISVSFAYPDGFAEGALAEVLPKMAIQDPVDPEYPEHARIIFTGYAGEYHSNTSPGIRVFRVEEVNAMDPAVITSLKAVLAQSSEDRFDFPRLPFAGRTVDAQVKNVSFGSGRGYRFMAQGSFDAAALRSTRLYYLYQGLTADEKYLATVLLEADAPFIADIATGEPFTSSQVADTYVTDVNNRINAAQPADFTPSLDVLDDLVHSLAVIEH